MSFTSQPVVKSYLANLHPGDRMLALIQALNAAASQLLSSAQREDDVFQAFGQQMYQLGLEGTFLLYDDDSDCLRVRHLTFAPEIMDRFKQVEEQLGFNLFEQKFPVTTIPLLATVITQKQPAFFPESRFFHIAFAGQRNERILKQTFGNRAVIVAPFLHGNQVLGLLSVSSDSLTEQDVPYIAAFANQTAVALMNVRLLAAARQTEQKYRDLFDKVTMMYALTEEREGTVYIVECNQFMIKQLGYANSELVGWPLAQIYSEPSRRKLQKGEHQKALAGTLGMEERQLLTKDGRAVETLLQTVPELNSEGQPARVRAMYVDITPYKETKETLRAYQEKLNRSLDELNILVPAGAIVTHATQNEEIIYDIAEYIAAAFDGDGCALYRSEPGQNILHPLVNVHRVRAIGGMGAEANTAPILIAPAIQQALTEKLTTFLSRSQPHLHPHDEAVLARHHAQSMLIIPMVVRDEVIGLAELYSYRGRDYDPRQRLFVQTLANYLAAGLENARLFEALRYANEDLEQRVMARTQELAARNQELDAFAHTVAHDLQGLLARVIMFAEAAVEEAGFPETEALQSYLKTILKNGRKMKEVISSLFLLTTVSKTEVTLTPLAMSFIIQDVLTRLEMEIQATNAYIDYPDSWPVVMGYRPWVEAMWVNYINNALKYGGERPHITLGATMMGSMVEFWVQDRGSGIALQDQKHLFEPFTQFHAREKGHGLGLSIVKRIATRLGGEVGVHSVVGQGSRFYFTLPQTIV